MSLLVLRDDCFVRRCWRNSLTALGSSLRGCGFEACGRVFGGDAFEDDEEAEA